MAPLLPYTIISPVKDEAVWLPQTIASIVGQTHRPERWVIVDDGSSDRTYEIAQGAAEEHPWIIVVKARGGGAPRARGAPIVRAFNEGLDHAGDGFEFVVKLDGDLFLPSHYFAWVSEMFARAPRVGIAGGRCWIFTRGIWKEDDVGGHTVAGNIKAYRMKCLSDIGGLQPSMGWDGIDELAARARGWEVAVATELQVLHYKLRGSRQKWWAARWEEGVGMRFMDYRLEFAVIRAGFRAVREAPFILSGAVMLAGFVVATLRGVEQVPDPLARAELRAEQRTRLRMLGRAGRGASRTDGPAFWSIPEERVGPAAQSVPEDA
jgi:glycosyltransferase involved in cell wall biosynthesis